jgi:V-type H+-transporting ATPase subunit a
VQLYIPTEVVHDTISELGEMGNFQFKDVRVVRPRDREHGLG